MPTVAQVCELPSLMEKVIPAAWLDLNGHVNVRHYLELYDAASWPMLAALGVDERLFLERRQGLFDLEHHLWYLDELHVGDTVTVHSRILDRTAKRYHGVMFIVTARAVACRVPSSTSARAPTSRPAARPRCPTCSWRTSTE